MGLFRQGTEKSLAISLFKKSLIMALRQKETNKIK